MADFFLYDNQKQHAEITKISVLNLKSINQFIVAKLKTFAKKH